MRRRDRQAIVRHLNTARQVKFPVIIPAYNEAENIGALLRELREAFPDAVPVVVSDGSIDDTARIAAEAGAVVLDLPCNLGVGGAVQTGFRYAVEAGFDIAVRIDGDGQHPPSEIPKLLSKMQESGADAVVGSRYLETNAAAVRGASAARDAGNIMLAQFLTLISRCRVTDPTSGFWCVRGDLLRCFARQYPSEYPEPEAIALLRRQGYELAETQVQIRPRAKGVSTIKTSGLFYFALRVGLALIADRFRIVDKRFANPKAKTSPK